MDHPSTAAAPRAATLSRPGLAENTLALDHVDIPVDGQGCDSIDLLARRRPVDLEFVDLWACSRFPGLRADRATTGSYRRYSSAADAYLSAGRPEMLRAHGVAIARDALQFQSQPVVALRRVVLKQDRRHRR